MTHRLVTRQEAALAPPRRDPTALRLPAKEVWIHHTVTPVTEDPYADWRTVQRVGFARGFDDLSYTCGVHPNLPEHVFEGRWLNVGAHTAGRNSRSLGVVLIGNYEEVEPPRSMIDSIRWVIWVFKQYGVLVKDAEPMAPTGGHRDLAATACPGRYAYARLDQMRVPWDPDAETPPEVPRADPAGPRTGPEVPPFPGRILRLTRPLMTGDDVRDFQWKLADRGWRIEFDGVYGPATVDVVRRFQVEKGLTVDGMVGPATWRAAWLAPLT